MEGAVFGDPMRTVYLLRSISSPGRRYVGVTDDLPRHLREHNTGKSAHTRQDAPWECAVAISFKDVRKANAFERYMKSGSGHAFAGRHFW